MSRDFCLALPWEATRRWGILLPLLLATMLGACSETQLLIHTAKKVSNAEDAARGTYKVGNPYQINGIWYYPGEDYEYDETGIASWYGPNFHGKDTANGEVYDMNDLTAAHRTLPMPSYVRVTNLENGRSVVLKINDRGPFAQGRILDASRRAAQLLGFEQKGTAKVRVQIMADESRAVAARLRSGTMLASVGTPITSPALPKETVSSEAILPPPGGAMTAPGAVPIPLPKPTPQVTTPRQAIQAPPLSVPGEVTVQPIGPSSIYVQAGAFAMFDNANRVRANLARLGNVNLTSVMVNGKDVYRVRVGPILDVDQADKLLERVIQAGYAGARIVVD